MCTWNIMMYTTVKWLWMIIERCIFWWAFDPWAGGSMVWPTSSKRLREIGSEDFIRNAFSGLKEMQTNAFKPQESILNAFSVWKEIWTSKLKLKLKLKLFVKFERVCSHDPWSMIRKWEIRLKEVRRLLSFLNWFSDELQLLFFHRRLEQEASPRGDDCPSVDSSAFSGFPYCSLTILSTLIIHIIPYHSFLFLITPDDSILFIVIPYHSLPFHSLWFLSIPCHSL